VSIRPCRILPARRMHSVSGVVSPASRLIASLVCRTASSLASTTMPGARISSTLPPRTRRSMISSGPLRTARVRSSSTSLHAVRSASRRGSVHRPSRRTVPCRPLMVSSSAAGPAGVPAGGRASAPSLPGAATRSAVSGASASMVRAASAASTRSSNSAGLSRPSATAARSSSMTRSRSASDARSEGELGGSAGIRPPRRRRGGAAPPAFHVIARVGGQQREGYAGAVIRSTPMMTGTGCPRRRRSSGAGSRPPTRCCSAPRNTPGTCRAASRTCSTGPWAAPSCTKSRWPGSTWPPPTAAAGQTRPWHPCSATLAAAIIEPACRHLPVDRTAIGPDGRVRAPPLEAGVAEVWQAIMNRLAPRG